MWLVENITFGTVESGLRKETLQARETMRYSGSIPESAKWLVGEKKLRITAIPTPSEKTNIQPVKAEAKKPKE